MLSTAESVSRCKKETQAGFAAKRKGTLARPLVEWKSSYFFFFLAAFLVAFFLVAMVSILPSICHGILRHQLSSQFVSCIESLKKIVKQKTHVQCATSTMREGARSRSLGREKLVALAPMRSHRRVCACVKGA